MAGTERRSASLRGAKAEVIQTPSFRDGALAPDLRCAIAHRGISRFRVRRGACQRAALCADPLASPRNDGYAFSCGRAVDERDVALTRAAALMRGIPGCGA